MLETKYTWKQLKNEMAVVNLSKANANLTS